MRLMATNPSNRGRAQGILRQGSKSSSGDDVLTIVEVAEYLKLPRSTTYKLAQEGKIPGQKVGRHWRFNRAAIDRWLVGDSDSSGGQSGGKGGAR